MVLQSFLRALAIAGSMSFEGGSIVWAQQVPPTAAAPDAAFEAARAAFDAMPDADRRALQDALVWTGDYASLPDGTFGRRTFEGLQAFQRRAKQAETGLPGAATVRAVKAAGDRARVAAGFATARDEATGVELGIPRKLLTKVSRQPNGGARYQSTDGKITLDTRTVPGDADELKDLYERTANAQIPGRTVTYKAIRPDFFVVTGDTASGRFYTRYAVGPGGLRGFSVGYDKGLAAEFDKVVIAMSNSFVPFPSTLPATSQSPPALPERARAQNVAASPRPEPPLTGLVVGPRLVATAATVETCRDPQAGGVRAKLVKADQTRGLALLELSTPRTAPAITASPLTAGQDVAVLFHAPGEGTRLQVTPARAISASGIVGPLQAGAAGAPVLDRSGRVVGLAGPLGEAPRAVAGLVPPATYGIVTSGSLREFVPLPERPEPANDSGVRSLGDLAAAFSAAVVPITCAATSGR